MKILYMIPTMGKGGAEDIIISLSNNLSADFKVTIFLLRRCEDDEYNISRISNNVDLILLDDYCKNKFLNNIKLISFIYKTYIAIKLFFVKKFFQFDVIHTNLTLSSILASFYQLISIILPFKKFKRTKYLETFHTNFHLLNYLQLIIFILGWNLRHKLIYEINEPEKHKIKKVLINKKKLVYIPFSAEEHSKNREKSFISFPLQNYKLITVSRMRLFEKKIDTMLETLSILRKDFDLPFELILAGDGKDLHLIKDMAEKLGLIDYVKFPGYVDFPQEFMHSGDIYMCAMVGDDPGISGIQACQQKIPLIGIQTLKNYASSPIFSSNIPEQIASKINNLVTKQDLNEYAESCMTFVNKKFSVNNMINKYKDLYYDFDEEDAL